MTSRIAAAALLMAVAGVAAGCEAKKSDMGGEGPDVVQIGDKQMKKVPLSPDYPMLTCPVSGDKLGEMGPAVAYVYDGTVVQFCCSECIDKFKKEPQKYLDQVKAAQKK